MPTGCRGEHGDWVAKSPDNSENPNDFTHPLLLEQHVNDTPEPTHDFTKCAQDIEWLKNKLNDLTTTWHRLPNFLRVDHAAKDTEVSGASNTFQGPGPFITYLNGRWAQQLQVSPTSNPNPGPNSFGWNNTSVMISNIWGSGDTIQQVVL
jgi:hypothetical protein